MFARQLEAMVDQGCSFIVGTVSPGGEPRATRAWGVRVIDDREGRVRFTMSADDRRSVDNLERGNATGSTVALTGADVRTLQAIQLKGRVVEVGEADDADVLHMDRQSELFFTTVFEVDGTRPELLKRILPLAVVAVEFVVDEVFNQTPGPGAGAAVGPSTSELA